MAGTPSATNIVVDGINANQSVEVTLNLTLIIDGVDTVDSDDAQAGITSFIPSKTGSAVSSTGARSTNSYGRTANQSSTTGSPMESTRSSIGIRPTGCDVTPGGTITPAPGWCQGALNSTDGNHNSSSSYRWPPLGGSNTTGLPRTTLTTTPGNFPSGSTSNSSAGSSGLVNPFISSATRPSSTLDFPSGTLALAVLGFSWLSRRLSV